MSFGNFESSFWAASMYLCGERGGNTKSMLIEIVHCRLCISISITLYVDSEMMQQYIHLSVTFFSTGTPH